MLRQLQVIIGIWKMHKHHKYEHISALFVWASLPGHRNNNGQPIMWVWGTTFFLSDQFQNAGWFWKIIRKIQEIIVIRKSRKRWWWWERTGKKQEREPGSNFRTNSPLVSAANELWGAAAGRMPVRWRRSGGMGRRREGTAPEGAWQPSPYSAPTSASHTGSVPLSHCILQTFTLFKDKCIVNSVSPHTRYVRRSAPSTAKGLSPLLPTRHATNEIKWMLLECRII